MEAGGDSDPVLGVDYPAVLTPTDHGTGAGTSGDPLGSAPPTTGPLRFEDVLPSAEEVEAARATILAEASPSPAETADVMGTGTAQPPPEITGTESDDSDSVEELAQRIRNTAKTSQFASQTGLLGHYTRMGIIHNMR
jgi:hypothetical protein